MSLVGELAKDYENALKDKRRAQEDEKSANKDIREIAQELLEAMALDGLKSVKTASGMTIFRKEDVFVSRAEGVSRGELVNILARHEQTMDLVSPNYNASSLQSRYREMVETEQPVPEELAAALKITKVPALGTRS